METSPETSPRKKCFVKENVRKTAYFPRSHTQQLVDIRNHFKKPLTDLTPEERFNLKLKTTNQFHKVILE